MTSESISGIFSVLRECKCPFAPLFYGADANTPTAFQTCGLNWSSYQYKATLNKQARPWQTTCR